MLILAYVYRNFKRVTHITMLISKNFDTIPENIALFLFQYLLFCYNMSIRAQLSIFFDIHYSKIGSVMRQTFFYFRETHERYSTLDDARFSQPAFPRISIDFRTLKMKLKIMSSVDNNGHFYGKVLLYIMEWYGNYCTFCITQFHAGTAEYAVLCPCARSMQWVRG